MAYTSELKIFSGGASEALTQGVCKHLDVEKARCTVSKFSDGEINIQIGENVRGRDVFLVNSTSPPVNRHLMELLIMIDAAKRASAERITAVLPYFGYARQDRKDKARVPITAKLVANLITAAGANRVLTVDLHCGQIQGFFDIPVDHLTAEVVFSRFVEETDHLHEDFMVISPDTGSVARAREFANRLGAPLAIVDKRRPKENVAEVMNIIGDVSGKNCLVFDDMIDTAGTLVKAAKALKEHGAKSVRACATHPIFSGPAVSIIEQSDLEQLIVCDSIPLSDEMAATSKVTVLSLAPLIGEAIRRIHKDESVSSLFRHN
ncbi:MAG: ribose-phosphate pyrophosphokinase [Candidatus Hydrogenedentes bacterium]|nr:ribose-phosphate pyrophosphokinase [Candidatus Hydrogenedentota bacterium]MBI3117471.1 ribose-phosphate pyrophosphokinase [Candidatus Hydrogenedentota bacterium]